MGCAEDVAAVTGVLQGPFLTSAGVGRSVETQLCDFFGVPRAKLTNSWTNGAVATLMALGIGPGDEVIVPAMTFIATANVVELLGAKPVFVDVRSDTLLIDIEKVRSAISPKSRAVIPVHLYGQMVDIAALRAVCGDGIAIVEDCAHCFEGSLNGMRPSAHSEAAIFSFYATKNVTCGEGGAIVSSDEALMDEIQKTVLHGMSAGADKRFQGQIYRHWDMDRLGTKANLPDILACLLPRQIAEVHTKRDERERLAERYRSALAGLEGVALVEKTPGGVSAHHLFALGVPRGTRDRVLRSLNEAGVGTTVNYRAVHEMKFYKGKYDFPSNAFPVASDWGDRTLSLPLFPGLTDEEQNYVIDCLAATMAQVAGAGEVVTS